MKLNSRYYVLRPGFEETTMSGIGPEILRLIATSQVDTEFSTIIDQLLAEFDVERARLVRDATAFVDDLIARGIVEDVDSLPLNSLDLSVTSACNAKCIYCPTPRVQTEQQLVELDTVRKLIADLSEPAFVARFGRLRVVEVGGLAEPLLHPGLVEILTEFRDTYPVADTILYTNGVLLDASLVQRLIDHALITRLVISIDGVTEREHLATKGISLDTVRTNLLRFIEHRDRVCSPCTVHIQTMAYSVYGERVRAAFGRRPLAVGEIQPGGDGTAAAVIAQWAPILSAGDSHRDAADSFQFRGEYRRDGDRFFDTDSQQTCPWVPYVSHSINITANGDWIICCNDFFKESVLGNILESPLQEIAATTRRDFVRALVRGDLDELPSRCRQASYCQFLSHSSASAES